MRKPGSKRVKGFIAKHGSLFQVEVEAIETPVRRLVTRAVTVRRFFNRTPTTRCSCVSTRPGIESSSWRTRRPATVSGGPEPRWTDRDRRHDRTPSVSVHWSSSSGDWSTPLDLFHRLDRIHHFTLDAAANAANAKVESWLGPDHPEPRRRDALRRNWHLDGPGGSVWLNPPYGRTIGSFMAKARLESQHVTVVCLVPVRTDTRWWHDHCAGQEVEFLRRRLKFNGQAKDAPFPSAVVTMRPPVTDSRYTCAHCGDRFLHRRSDAKYCSGRCRTASCRARQ
jgi:phage N-6-adenine-methyltransferase